MTHYDRNVPGSFREETVAKRVHRLIEGQLDVSQEEIKEDAFFIQDLGADSLTLVELLLAVEEEFEMDIPDEDWEAIIPGTVNDLVGYLTTRIGVPA